MDVQLLRQAVLLENQLEAVGEGGGRHGELRALTAEQEVIIGQFPLVIGFGDVCTFLPVLPQETFHLGGEVHIAITRAGLWLLDEDLLVRHLDRVAADVDGTLLPINVAPFQSAALTPPHSRGDDELEVGFVLDALALQRGDDLLRRVLVRDLLFTLAPSVAVGAPSRIMRKKATLHGIREDAAQRSVHALNGVLGEWLFCVGTDNFSQLCVETSEVLRPQLGELVVTQHREDTLDVLPVAADGGLRQLAGRDVRQPQVDVFCQRELLDGLRRMAALPLKEDCLFIEPLFDLPGRQLLRRVDGFLLGLDALAIVVIAHGDHDEIAAAALADRRSSSCLMLAIFRTLPSFAHAAVLLARRVHPIFLSPPEPRRGCMCHDKLPSPVSFKIILLIFDPALLPHCAFKTHLTVGALHLIHGVGSQLPRVDRVGAEVGCDGVTQHIQLHRALEEDRLEPQVVKLQRALNGGENGLRDVGRVVLRAEIAHVEAQRLIHEFAAALTVICFQPAVHAADHAGAQPDRGAFLVIIHIFSFLSVSSVKIAAKPCKHGTLPNDRL